MPAEALRNTTFTLSPVELGSIVIAMHSGEPAKNHHRPFYRLRCDLTKRFAELEPVIYQALVEALAINAWEMDQHSAWGVDAFANHYQWDRDRRAFVPPLTV